MNITTRRKRLLDREFHYRDATLCVVAVEGAVTESIYFSIFTDPSKPIFNRRVKIIPLVDKEYNKSNPEAVLDRLDKYKRENDYLDSDQFWLVCDFDRWQEHGKLSTVLTSCKQKSYQMAVSNPNFEIWLYFHFSSDISEIASLSTGDKKTSIQSKLSNFMGKTYKKNNYSVEMLIPKIEYAITNSKEHDNPPTTSWPDPIGTTVYRLIEWIVNQKS